MNTLQAEIERAEREIRNNAINPPNMDTFELTDDMLVKPDEQKKEGARKDEMLVEDAIQKSRSAMKRLDEALNSTSNNSSNSPYNKPSSQQNADFFQQNFKAEQESSKKIDYAPDLEPKSIEQFLLELMKPRVKEWLDKNLSILIKTQILNQETIIQCLKPMLAEWLNKNLPDIVEKIVEKELNKIRG